VVLERGFDPSDGCRHRLDGPWPPHFDSRQRDADSAIQKQKQFLLPLRGVFGGREPADTKVLQDISFRA
jgi:hypothetical protein